MRGSASRVPAAAFGLGAAAIAALAYLPALAVGFTSDDFLIVALLRETGGLDSAGTYFQRGFYDYYRPVTFLSHAIDWELWETRAAGFHATNVLLHAVNTGLVFFLARRMLTPFWAVAAALLFGLHPSSHEAVYWVAARFDLLATAFGLGALLALTSVSRLAWTIGLLAFALALLAKESAVAVPLLVAAYDVWIARRPRAEVVRRAVPLLLVLAGYAVLRSAAADIPAAGGRTGKLLLFAIGFLALVALAKARDGADADAESARIEAAPGLRPWSLAAVMVAALTSAAFLPPTSLWVREKLTFVAYAAFHLFSPVVQPPPPAWFVDPQTPAYWLAGLAVCGAVASSFVIGWPLLRRVPALAFAVAFAAAALLPVSTMTGGTRYLYLASAGTSLALALLAQTPTVPWRSVVRAAVVLMLALAPMQIVLAGRAWIWASEMSADASAAVAPKLTPCGTAELVLLTAPVQIRGVYSNLNAETFSTAGCAPATMRALTRVLRDDVAVELVSTGAAIEWRIPADSGNVVASRDLRTFDVPLRSPGRLRLETPIGALDTWREGASRRFRFEPSATASRRVFAYYGSGRVRLVPGTVQ